MKKVMAFGTFDIFHAGHRHFLNEAKKLGDNLVVVVAPDAVVERIKERKPQHSIEKRKKEIIAAKLAHEVVTGDEKDGEWEILRLHRPDVIAVGYDQDELATALADVQKQFDFPFEVVKISAHQPDIYRTSLLRKKHGR